MRGHEDGEVREGMRRSELADVLTNFLFQWVTKPQSA